MSLKKNRSLVNALVTVPVALIVLSAAVLCVAAIRENLRFIRSTNDILSLVTQVRSVTAQQKTFALNVGEDLWADLTAVGQIANSTTHLNPWDGAVRAVTVNAAAMRVETELPIHDCRRMAWFFLDRHPQELGLLAIEAHGVDDGQWRVIYAPPAPQAAHAVEIACGHGTSASLGFVFKMR